MKFSKVLFLFSLAFLMTLQVFSAKVWAETKTVALFQEAFNVPGPGKYGNGGTEKPFTLDNKSTVTLTIASTKQKPSLDVFVLDADNYSKYQSSGTLANLTLVTSLSKLDTLAFKTTADLAAGKYVLFIRWHKVGLFYTAPEVGIKLIAEEHIEPKPTPTPKGFWSSMFGSK